MTAWPALLILLAVAAPPVEISTLDGEQHVGQLERLTTSEVTLKSEAGSVQIPAGELLTIRVSGASASLGTESMFEVRLTDATLLRVTSFLSTASQAIVTHPQLGELKLPLTNVQSVRFAAPDAKVDAEWKQLLSRASRKDQVAIRKNDILDHLDGVIGPLDAATIKFRLDGDDIPVKRERVFGLIYAKRDAAVPKAAASIDLVTGDRLTAKTVSFDGDNWKIALATGTAISVPTANLMLVDFTQGRIAYLSDMEPRDAKLTPYFDLLLAQGSASRHSPEPRDAKLTPYFDRNDYFVYRRDRSPPRSAPGPAPSVSFGTKKYAKSLSMHSRTTLKYRIGGDYRRFQAVMGIDDFFRYGNVDVVIKGDGRTLLSEPARAGQPPQKVDLDVTGVVELEITVDFGADNLDIGDWLNLADAKLVK